MQGEGYTRDISSAGVFVITDHRLPSGTMLKLEVALPSPRGQRSGAHLRTQGQVGFAAAANMGFRMQLSEMHSSEQSFSRGNGGTTHEAHSKETKPKFVFLVPRSYSA